MQWQQWLVVLLLPLLCLTSGLTDVGMDVMSIVQARGFHVEHHNVTTSDGYILSVFRLPLSYDQSQRHRDKTSVGRVNKPAVLLLHGLLDSSFTWVSNFRHQSLAYLLADAGYDVYLGNNRGTTWSRRHVFLDITSRDFWDFSWEDMARYDMPAMVRYVLEYTNQSSLAYIGHSEGTMQAFAGFSLDQELGRKISFFAALAPVAYIQHQKSPVFSTLVALRLDRVLQWFGSGEFFSAETFIQRFLGPSGCSWFPTLCGHALNMFNGNAFNLNNSRIPVYISQTPAGTSVKNIVHFAQGIRQGTFSRFDYGCTCNQFPFKYFRWCPFSCENQRRYGQVQPPRFNLSKLEYPKIGLFVGLHDALSTPEDYSRTRSELPSTSIDFEVYVPFNHLDFTWAINANEFVYSQLIFKLKFPNPKR